MPLPTLFPSSPPPPRLIWPLVRMAALPNKAWHKQDTRLHSSLSTPWPARSPSSVHVQARPGTSRRLMWRIYISHRRSTITDDDHNKSPEPGIDARSLFIHLLPSVYRIARHFHDEQIFRTFFLF
ncbi:hypothetical protein RvY_18942-3 [Ramazzottius varieornatus]|uniref:Uncharacterized protein n=1 Tax=Ramazzottius varieornatus TaxID=947166 RepID=A0A1D1W7N6_RAMVA|nr:hypothetical protein RvY_18942-3 [Ramazzottius varieornatus]